MWGASALPDVEVIGSSGRARILEAEARPYSHWYLRDEVDALPPEGRCRAWPLGHAAMVVSQPLQ
jgi:hypothetical protein